MLRRFHFATFLAIFAIAVAPSYAGNVALNSEADEPVDPELGPETQQKKFQIGKTQIGGSIDLLSMAALGKDGVDTATGTDFTMTMRRGILDDIGRNPLDVYVRMRYRKSLGDISPSALGEQIGAAWGVVDGFTNGGFEVPELFLRQFFPRRSLELRYGQMVMDSQFDAQPVGGAKSAFLNRAFSSNPAVAFPRLGAGLTAEWAPEERPWEILLGVTTVQGTSAGSQVDFTFGSGDLFQALQVSYKFDRSRSQRRRLQWMIWHADAVEETESDEGSGSSVTYSYHLPSWNSEAFSRLTWARGAATDARFLVVTGIVTEVRDQEKVGIGLGLGRGIRPSNWQAVGEAFYRRSIGDHGGISVNAQLLAGEGFIGGGSLRLVLGAGARFFF